MATRKHTIEIEINAKDKASNVVSGIHRNLQQFGKVALAGIATAAAAAVGGAAMLGKRLADMAAEAAPLQGIRTAFEGIAESAGTTSEALLAAFKEQTAGMITNADAMKSFNLAAQLVSEDFATRLPNAMQFLGKVSAATGEDIGFLLESLVRGVGRLSPMILDNLGIQVDLNQAYQDYADKMGIAVDAMTKTEQQTALMDQVMALLADNTAAMPDILDNTSTAMGRMKASFEDFKNELGEQLLPVWDRFIKGAEQAWIAFEPLVVGLFQNILLPVITALAAGFETFFTAINLGADPIDALTLALGVFFSTLGIEGSGVIGAIQKAKDVFNEWWPVIFVAWRHIKDFVTENKLLRAFLIAVGVAIATVVIPALASVVTSMAPVLLTIAAVVAAVALLSKAWETDFLGIRTTAEETWGRIVDLVTGYIAVWKEQLEPVLEQLRDIWQDEIIPILEEFGITMEDGIIPMLGDLLVGAINTALAALTLFLLAFKTFLPLIAQGIKSLSAFARQVMSVVRAVTQLSRRLTNLTLPRWARRRSPSEIEQTFMGLNEQMSQLNSINLPRFKSNLTGLGGNTTNNSTNNNFNLTVNSNAPTEPIISDFRMMQTFVGS